VGALRSLNDVGVGGWGWGVRLSAHDCVDTLVGGRVRHGPAHGCAHLGGLAAELHGVD